MTNNSQTIQDLKILLADSYALYLKTQNYHWNVKGIHFVSLHNLFEEQYTELAQAIDEIAEVITARKEIAPGSFSEYADLTNIREADSSLDALAMVKDLLESNEQIVKSATKLLRAAEDETDDTAADLATTRIVTHEKTAWMLRSLLG